MARTAGSRPGFLISGWTTACLKFSGTTPEDKMLFMAAMTDGPIVGKTSLKSRGGTASSGEPEGLKRKTISCKKDRVTGSNWLKTVEEGTEIEGS